MSIIHDKEEVKKRESNIRELMNFHAKPATGGLPPRPMSAQTSGYSFMYSL